MNYEQRSAIEKQIIAKVIMDALLAGYTLGVNDGEETTLRYCDKPVEIMATMFTTEEDYLLFYKDGKSEGWVHFIYGNDGWDVIADNTVNLEEVLKGATELADQLSISENAGWIQDKYK